MAWLKSDSMNPDKEIKSAPTLAHEPQFEWESAWNSNPSFPLTPALSPWERENRFAALYQSAAPLWSGSGARYLPLPKGEGRGEGEGSVVPHVAFEFVGFTSPQRTKTSTCHPDPLPVKRRGKDSAGLLARTRRFVSI